MKFISILSVTLLPFAIALPVEEVGSLVARQSLQQITDTLLFTDTIDQFEAARNAQNPAGLDWSSDNCTNSPDQPFGFNFIPPCQRHDFGYRNYKAQNRFTTPNKDRIDNNFKNDMYNVCAGYSEPERTFCEGVADTYYEAVHLFGRKRQALTA